MFPKLQVSLILYETKHPKFPLIWTTKVTFKLNGFYTIALIVIYVVCYYHVRSIPHRPCADGRWHEVYFNDFTRIVINDNNNDTRENAVYNTCENDLGENISDMWTEKEWRGESRISTPNEYV